MKKILFLILSFFILASATTSFSKIEYKHFLDVNFAYYPGNYKGYGITGFAPVNFNKLDYTDTSNATYANTTNNGRNDMGNVFAVELKAYYTFQIMVPMLRSSNALMKDNNLKIQFKANITPVSIEGGVNFVLTPIAFLKFELGSRIATGWDLSFMNLNGLALNQPNFAYSATQKSWVATPGLVSFTEASATFQFDLAAIMPGDWNHVIVSATEKFEFKYFTGATSSVKYWRWEHDEGENENGFVWHQSFFVGYQMPKVPVLDTVGILVTTEQKLTGMNDSKMSVANSWGSDFMIVKFGPLINLKFNKNHSMFILFEFKTARDYQDNYMGEVYFVNRRIDSSSPTFVYFDRVALGYSCKF